MQYRDTLTYFAQTVVVIGRARAVGKSKSRPYPSASHLMLKG